MGLRKRLVSALSRNLHTRRLLKFCQLVKSVIRKGSYYTRSFFYLPEKKLLYVSISKAGNTSIKASMFDLPDADDYRTIHKAIKAFHKGKGIRHINEFADYYKFTFVRNPFQRLVSCYENKLHTDQAKVGKSISFLIYDCYLLGFLAKDRGFRSFARRVCMIPDRIADRHFVSQSMGMLDADGKLLIDYVGKLEQMTADYEPIRQRFDLKPLPHYNRTAKPGQNWMDYYDLDTARRVYRRYQTDIERFGYQSAYDELVEYLKKRKTH